MTNDEIISKNINEGMTISDIAKQCNSTRRKIYTIFKQAGIKPLKNNKNQLLGQKFYKLTVVSEEPLNKYRQTQWKCLCDCGNYTVVVGTLLKGNKVKSCGCLLRLTGKDSWNFQGHEEIPREFFNKIIRGANDRNLEYSLSDEYLWKLYLSQDRKCALSGVNIEFGKGRRNNKSTQTVSVDRIDSSKGYVEGNVQWVHKTVNIMKQSLSDEEFINWCKLIAEKN